MSCNFICLFLMLLRLPLRTFPNIIAQNNVTKHFPKFSSTNSILSDLRFKPLFYVCWFYYDERFHPISSFCMYISRVLTQVTEKVMLFLMCFFHTFTKKSVGCKCMNLFLGCLYFFLWFLHLFL
jgi:hypothetical protein